MRWRRREDGDHQPWVVFGDIMLGALFAFVLFIFVVFLDYNQVEMRNELTKRKHELMELFQESLPDRYADSVTVEFGAAFRQPITFTGDVLFDPCQDALKPAGDTLVAIVGRLLADRSHYFESIEIEGHTDLRPPPGGSNCRFKDNWELSSRRAATVVRIMTQKSELQPEGLSAVGRAEFHNLSDPTSRPLPAEPAFNEFTLLDRRIEIVLQYSEKDIVDYLGRTREAGL